MLRWQKSYGTYIETDTGVCGTSGEPKKIALTFDDGPHPKYTEQLLDGLKERGVVATFFVTGENAENYPDIIRREQDYHYKGDPELFHRTGYRLWRLSAQYLQIQKGVQEKKSVWNK